METPVYPLFNAHIFGFYGQRRVYALGIALSHGEEQYDTRKNKTFKVHIYIYRQGWGFYPKNYRYLS
jgi:hypothetical protein